MLKSSQLKVSVFPTIPFEDGMGMEFDELNSKPGLSSVSQESIFMGDNGLVRKLSKSYIAPFSA